VHFDANFKLTLEKRESRGDGSKSLWGGDGYFVDDIKYREYLDTTSTQREASRLLYHLDEAYAF
jgi:hypothetical protein